MKKMKKRNEKNGIKKKKIVLKKYGKKGGNPTSGCAHE